MARIFNTYGPSMHPHDGRVVSNFAMQALLGEPVTIYGDGQQTRSFCYVDDIVAGLVALMDAADDVTGPVNLGNPDEITILDLARTILDLTGSRARLLFAPLPVDDPVRRCPEISRARSLLGWEPRVSLATGLPQTIDYFASLVERGRAEEPTVDMQPLALEPSAERAAGSPLSASGRAS